MDKYESVEKFKNLIMDEFLQLCNYNDYNKINLLIIGETIDRVFDEHIKNLIRDDEQT